MGVKAESKTGFSALPLKNRGRNVPDSGISPFRARPQAISLKQLQGISKEFCSLEKNARV